jgi:hypothetical protein
MKYYVRETHPYPASKELYTMEITKHGPMIKDGN